MRPATQDVIRALAPLIIPLCFSIHGCTRYQSPIVAVPDPEAGLSRELTSTEWAIGAPDYVPAFHPDTSLDEFARLLELGAAKRASHPEAPQAFDKPPRYLPSKHLLTLGDGSRTIEVYTARIHPYVSLLFVFDNKQMIKIVRGVSVSVGAPPTVELSALDFDEFEKQKRYAERLWTQIHDAKGLSVEEYRQHCLKSISDNRHALKALEPNPVLDLFPRSEQKNARQYKKHLDLMRRFDPSKFTVGTSRDEVRRSFGNALQSLEPIPKPPSRAEGSN